MFAAWTSESHWCCWLWLWLWFWLWLWLWLWAEIVQMTESRHGPRKARSSHKRLDPVGGFPDHREALGLGPGRALGWQISRGLWFDGSMSSKVHGHLRNSDEGVQSPIGTCQYWQRQNEHTALLPPRLWTSARACKSLHVALRAVWRVAIGNREHPMHEQIIRLLFSKVSPTSELLRTSLFSRD